MSAQISTTSLPNDWVEARIGSLFSENPKSKIKVEEASAEGIYPFFTSGEAILFRDDYLIDGESIFLATGGVANVKYFAGKASYSSDTYCITAKDIDSRLLFYNLFKNLELINYHYFEGSGLKHLQKDNFKKLTLRFPRENDEQIKISEILTIIDLAIEKTDQLIEKYKHIKQGLMQDLFRYGIDENGQIRSEKTHKFKDSPLGKIPQEWAVGILKNLIVGAIKNGYFKKPELVGSGYRLINVSDLYQDYGINTDRVERVAASKKEFAKNEVVEGDCFFTRSSLVLEGIAQCNILRKINEPTIFECHVMRARPNKNRINPEFLAHWCRAEYARKYFMSMAKQVTMTTIDQGGLYEIRIPLPSIPEQESIVKSIDAIAVTIEKEECYKQKLIALKCGLMDDLLSGKVRVTGLMN